MKDDILTLLRGCDTPTVCNAIEVVQGRRGFAGFTRGTVLSSAPEAGAMVGHAVTAKIAGSAPPAEDAATIRARRMEYYRRMADGPKPAIAVIEDVDHPHCVGAFWGEVNTWIHKSLGLSGVLTNGVMRDLGDLAPDFPVIAGSIGPSHGFVHVREIGTTVTVFGLTVRDGDLIHADRHGAVVIPPEVIDALPAGIERLRASERMVLDRARQGAMSFDDFASAWAAFEVART